MTSISLNTVTKQFGDVEAVADADVEIKDGEFISIVGPSGCGKTTTLRMVAGLEEVSDGSVYFDESDVTTAPPKDRNVGMVFQNLALYPHMTVRENMAFGLRILDVAEDERSDRIQNAAEMLDIPELLDREPAELSGGQQQRVAIGRTMVLDPDVFLLDEPLASLDAKLRVEIREELQELHREIGVTTVYVTHDQEQAMTMSDRIIVMNKGEIQQFAAPEEIYNNPKNEFVAHFIGTPSMNFFDCTLTADGDDLVAELDFHDVHFDASDVAGVEAGDDVRLGVRPEHLDLRSDESSGFGADVRFVEPTGKDKIIHLTVGDHDLKAITPGERPIEAGMTLQVVFDTDRIDLFDSKTGTRVY